MTTCSFWTDFAGIKAKTVTEMIILTAIISHFSVFYTEKCESFLSASQIPHDPPKKLHW